MSYENLDTRIMLAIEARKHPLYEYHCCQEAMRIQDATGREIFRIIDGRIQSLRKAGRITFEKRTRNGRFKEWQVVS